MVSLPSQIIKVVVVTALVPALRFCQPSQSTTSAATIHITGSLSQCGKTVPRLWVVFEGNTRISVRANESGAYEADLPLGVWTAITTSTPAHYYDSLSRPRHFRATAPSKVTLNLNLRPPVFCDLMIITHGGHPATPEELSRRDSTCWGEEFFQMPSTDGVPLEVDLFGLSSSGCSVEVARTHREVATYNLLSVEADHVAYNSSGKTLEASGDVVIRDEFGERMAKSITMKLEDGKALTTHSDR
jgi:hypothetical protein